VPNAPRPRRPRCVWCLAALVLVVLLALWLLFERLSRQQFMHIFGGPPPMPDTSITTGFRFEPPFEWTFSIAAPDARAADQALEKLVSKLRSEAKKRQITLTDQRSSIGVLTLTTHVNSDARPLVVRMLIASAAPTIGAACGEEPARWEGHLYADFAVFERLGTGDVDPLRWRMDAVREVLAQIARDAAAAVPAIEPQEE
jgi:hypothetical protein